MKAYDYGNNVDPNLPICTSSEIVFYTGGNVYSSE